jgi:hypothetical protein
MTRVRVRVVSIGQDTNGQTDTISLKRDVGVRVRVSPLWATGILSFRNTKRISSGGNKQGVPHLN